MKRSDEKKTEQAIISPELTARAKAGDQAAYTELYEKTYAALYRTICSMTRDEDTAWDILQESYLRAFQNLEKLDANEAFVTWLRRIAVNETARVMGRRTPVNFSELSSEEEDDMPEIPDLRLEAQPELVIDQQETSRLVREIMADLPEQQPIPSPSTSTASVWAPSASSWTNNKPQTGDAGIPASLLRVKIFVLVAI